MSGFVNFHSQLVPRDPFKSNPVLPRDSWDVGAGQCLQRVSARAHTHTITQVLHQDFAVISLAGSPCLTHHPIPHFLLSTPSPPPLHTPFVLVFTCWKGRKMQPALAFAKLPFAGPVARSVHWPSWAGAKPETKLNPSLPRGARDPSCLPGCALTTGSWDWLPLS